MAMSVMSGSFGRRDSLEGASKDTGETPIPPDALALGPLTGGGVEDVDGVFDEGEANRRGLLVCKERKARTRIR